MERGQARAGLLVDHAPRPCDRSGPGVMMASACGLTSTEFLSLRTTGHVFIGRALSETSRSCKHSVKTDTLCGTFSFSGSKLDTGRKPSSCGLVALVLVKRSTPRVCRACVHIDNGRYVLHDRIKLGTNTCTRAGADKTCLALIGCGMLASTFLVIVIPYP